MSKFIGKLLVKNIAKNIAKDNVSGSGGNSFLLANGFFIAFDSALLERTIILLPPYIEIDLTMANGTYDRIEYFP